ncbi:MAG: sulfite exporter TauE/SafE family protein [Pseudomonadota bacterium]
MTLLPPDLGTLEATLLVGLSFFTSAITSAVGLGGGVVMLAVLATVAPPAAVIPVHEVVQFGANVSRSFLMRRHVDRRLLLPFAIGTVIGAGLGALLVVELPVEVLRLVLGLFILGTVWGPKFRGRPLSPRGFGLVGLVTSFVTMFVGATGPFVAAFLDPDRLGRLATVGTHASCMVLQHGLKVAAFTALGFAFLPWLPLLAAMIGVGFLGTVAGRHLLRRLPERAFAVLFKAVLTILALRLLYDALGAWAAAGTLPFQP